MGRHRGETTMESFQHILRSGGVRAFYGGMGPKLIESATKGGVLLVAKDFVQGSLCKAGVSPHTSGFLSGAAGGIAQTVVMGPTTFLVTAAVLQPGATMSGVIRQTWREKGMAGFYPGGSAIAARQASNWASRVGFTEAIRARIAVALHGNPKHRLSVKEEAVAGIFGGVLSCWNHPLEVARIEMQARALLGGSQLSMLHVLRHVHAESGFAGLFQGLVPRMGTNIWLTLFLVSGAHVVKSLREASERQSDRLVRVATGKFAWKEPVVDACTSAVAFR